MTRAHSQTILLVDDDTHARKSMRRLLSRRLPGVAPCAVIEARNGPEALQLLAESDDIGCILLDFRMPGMDGMQVLEAVRRMHLRVAVIMVTGVDDVDLAVRAMKSGAIDYMVKGSITPTRLGHGIASALARASSLEEEKTKLLMPPGAMTPELAPPGYRVLSLIGTGAQSAVYLAERSSQEQPWLCALKVLRQFGGSDPAHVDNARERFLHEARATSVVSHVNVVRLLDFGLSPGRDFGFLAMEYVRGRSLRELMARERNLEQEGRLEILMQVARGLEAAHAAGICHRDVKPENILVAEDGTAKLTDFGVARIPDSNLTATYELMGTPAYMAPECLKSSCVDARADVFSLGVVAYELFVGVRPFVASGLVALAQKILNGTYRLPRDAVPNMAPSLDAVLRKMLAPAPDDRYRGAAELAEDLRRLIAQSADTQVQVASGGEAPRDKRTGHRDSATRGRHH